jgi:hypothetical protein
MRVRDSITAIVVKYGIFSIRASIGSLSCRFADGTPIAFGEQALQTASLLLQLNVARPGMYVQQHAAISNLALNVVAGKSTLRGHLMVVELERS